MIVQRNLYFSPLKKRKQLDKNIKIVSFDTEYDSITKQFKLMSICQLRHLNNSFQFKTETFFNVSDFIDYIASKNITLLYCYNINADVTFILSELHRRNVEFNIIESSKILGVSFKLNNKKIVIKDFFNFALCSLDSFSKSMNCIEKKYPNFDNQIEWDNFFKNCSMFELQRHCEQDCKILCESMFRFRRLVYDEFSVDFMNLKIYSLASLSLKIYRTCFLKQKLSNSFISLLYDTKSRKYSSVVNRDDYEFVKKTYKGGYTDCFSNKLYNDVVSFDINSSYPFQATKIKYFPCGKCYYTKYLKEFLLRTQKIAGFCECEIEFTHDNRYFIPVIDSESKFKRVFGTITQHITSIELKYLIEHNVKVKFVRGCYFRQYDKSFSLENFYKSLYLKRKNRNESNPLRLIFKIIMNSLYGKFGQRIDSKRTIYHLFHSLDECEQYLTKLNASGHIRKISDELYTLNEEITQENRKSFMFVSWSSLITASGRIQLLDMIQKTNAIMFDTDSVYCEKKNVPSDLVDSNELGGWKLEKTCSEFRCLAPKFYAMTYFDNKTKEYKKEVKAKGIVKEKRLNLYDSIIQAKSTININDIVKTLSFKEVCRNIVYTHDSDLFVKTHIMSKTINPNLKYIDVELELIESLFQ